MAAVEVADLEDILECTPESVRREASQAAATAEAHNRRAHPRHSGDQLRRLRLARLKNGPQVSIVDLSRGGALIETRRQMKPGAIITLQMGYDGSSLEAPSEVLRCAVATLNGTGLIYRAACSFHHLVALDRMREHGPGADALDARNAPGAWQKVVARYREGGMLKGYTMDFHPSRGQISLWPTIDARPSERSIVPLTRLKALFFVKDFAGDGTHVPVIPGAKRMAGRAIEITFFDREILQGTTLGYRPDAVGFFVTPDDSRGNNQRVFVITAAVRNVRFP
jgi:hypothetical protein